MKTALHLIDQRYRSDFEGDKVQATSELRFDFDYARESSRLMNAILSQQGGAASQQDDPASKVFAYRTLRSFTRGQVEVSCGGWILLLYEGKSIVGRVCEIVQLHVAHAASNVLRMLMSEARIVEFEDDLRGKVITVQRDSEASELLVCAERASMLEVNCDETSATYLTYEYIY